MNKIAIKKMKNYLKSEKNNKFPLSLFLVFSFIYFMMCPFAQALISDISSQILIPQKQVTKNQFKQKDPTLSPPYLSEQNQLETWGYERELLNVPTTTHQESAFSLSIITTSRLII